MLYLKTMLSFTRRGSYSYGSSRAGITLPEILVAAVMFAILIGGVVYFSISQRRTVSSNEVQRNLVKQSNQMRRVVVRELDRLGFNPAGSPFDMPGGTPVTGYRPCDGFPVYNPGDSDTQMCFGITDGRVHKLEFTGDTGNNGGTLGDGLVQNGENTFLAVRDGSGTVYDDTTAAGPGLGGLPSFFSKIDMTNYQHTQGALYEPTLFMPDLPSIPQLCTLTDPVNDPFDEQFDLVAGTYDASDSRVYRLLLSRVLCFAVAYIRKPHDYEKCMTCYTSDNGKVARSGPPFPAPPQGTRCLPPVAPATLPALPTAFFAGQAPFFTQQEWEKGLVFQPFPAGPEGQPLDPNSAYLTHIIRLTIIVEDDKVWRVKDASTGQQWEDPLTGRPYRTLRLDIDYYIPEENKPCDMSLGSCEFNNEQCER